MREQLCITRDIGPIGVSQGGKIQSKFPCSVGMSSSSGRPICLSLEGTISLEGCRELKQSFPRGLLRFCTVLFIPNPVNIAELQRSLMLKDPRPSKVSTIGSVKLKTLSQLTTGMCNAQGEVSLGSYGSLILGGKAVNKSQLPNCTLNDRRRGIEFEAIRPGNAVIRDRRTTFLWTETAKIETNLLRGFSAFDRAHRRELTPDAGWKQLHPGRGEREHTSYCIDLGSRKPNNAHHAGMAHRYAGHNQWPLACARLALSIELNDNGRTRTGLVMAAGGPS
jgi:hypothetical protein